MEEIKNEKIKEEQNMIIIKPTVDMTHEKDDTLFDSQSTRKEDVLDTDETEDEEVKQTCLGKKFYTTSSDEDSTCDTEESEESEDDKESKMDDNEDEDEVDEESTISTHSDTESSTCEDDDDVDADGLGRDRSFHKTPPQKFTFDLNECEPGIIICKPKPITLKKFQGTSYENNYEDSSDHNADDEDHEYDYDNEEEEQSQFDKDSDIAESECSESDCDDDDDGEEESSVSSSSTSNYSCDEDEMQLEVEDEQDNIERPENEDDDESLEEEVSIAASSSSNDVESEDESSQSSVQSFVDQQDNSCVIESNEADMEQNEIHIEWKEVLGDDELLCMGTNAVSGLTTDSDASSIVAEELESIINSNNKEHMSFERQGELTYCDTQDNFGVALSSKRPRDDDDQVTDSKRRCTQLDSTNDGATLDETDEDTQVPQKDLHDTPIQSVTMPNIAQKPIPLLTPPITPCAIKSDESFVAICELPSDLVVDKSLPATIQLRALSPPSLVKLEDTNNYQGTIIQPRKVRSVTRDFSNAPQADIGLTSIIDTVVLGKTR